MAMNPKAVVVDPLDATSVRLHGELAELTTRLEYEYLMQLSQHLECEDFEWAARVADDLISDHLPDDEKCAQLVNDHPPLRSGYPVPHFVNADHYDLNPVIIVAQIWTERLTRVWENRFNQPLFVVLAISTTSAAFAGLHHPQSTEAQRHDWTIRL